LQSFIEDFSSQIHDYELLLNRDESQPITFEINSLKELPSILIKTRIAAKISQAELAAKIGKETKQIQRL